MRQAAFSSRAWAGIAGAPPRWASMPGSNRRLTTAMTLRLNDQAPQSVLPTPSNTGCSTGTAIGLLVAFLARFFCKLGVTMLYSPRPAPSRPPPRRHLTKEGPSGSSLVSHHNLVVAQNTTSRTCRSTWFMPILVPCQFTRKTKALVTINSFDREKRTPRVQLHMATSLLLRIVLPCPRLTQTYEGIITSWQLFFL